MIEQALTLKNYSFKTKMTCKTIISVVVIALAVALPQIVHMALGQLGGVKWLPMYLPVLLGGCLLGVKWGFAVGVLSPLVSFFITSAMGSPMPMAARLPYMMAELAVFAVVSGLFSNKIAKNGLWAFPAVILAQIAGRASFLSLIAATQSLTKLKTAMIWGQIKTGLVGLGVQAIAAPIIVILLKKLMIKSDAND